MSDPHAEQDGPVRYTGSSKVQATFYPGTRPALLPAPEPDGVSKPVEDATGRSAFDRADNTARLALEVADLERERAGLRAEVERLTEERDMFREKAHGFIRANQSYDERLGALVAGLQKAILEAELRAQMDISASHLRFLLGDDEPIWSDDPSSVIRESVLRDAIAELTAPTEEDDSDE